MLTVGSLFSGIGGLELGLERTGGFKTVWQVEIDDYATRVLERHWPHVRRWRDVTTFPPDATSCRSELAGTEQSRLTDDSLEAWHVDCICGGFPCQDISYAGKGAGLAGERSGLFYEVARIVGLLRPRYVLLENVAALLTRGLGEVLGTLASLGYDAEWHCVQAAAVGAPHIRDRVFIIGYLADTCCQGLENGDLLRGVCGEAKQRDAREAAVLGGNDVCDTTIEGLQNGTDREVGKSRQITKPKRSDWWQVEPNVGRVAHGVRSRVDRLRCLGNAVVPQVAEFIGHMVLDMEVQTR